LPPEIAANEQQDRQGGGLKKKAIKRFFTCRGAKGGKSGQNTLLSLEENLMGGKRQAEQGRG